MLTQNQEKYLKKIPADKITNIQPFDPKVAETAAEIIQQIKTEIPSLEIFFGGASALNIAGQNDIDLNLLSVPAEYAVNLPSLIKLFGQPSSVSVNLIKWEFERNGFEVELYLTDRNSPMLQEQIRTFEIINASPALKQEYEQIKLACNRLPFRDYMSKKYEFFNRILEAAGGAKAKAKIFIDGSNVFYTQKKLGWAIDWVKVKQHFEQERDILEFRYYTGLKDGDEGMQSYLRYLDAIGFVPITKPLKKIKVSPDETAATSKGGYIFKANFDVEMTADILLDKSEIREIILFSGDSDFKYLIEQLKSRGQKVIVVASKKTVSWELKLAANNMIYLEDLKDKIIRAK